MYAHFPIPTPKSDSLLKTFFIIFGEVQFYDT